MNVKSLFTTLQVLAKSATFFVVAFAVLVPAVVATEEIVKQPTTPVASEVPPGI